MWSTVTAILFFSPQSLANLSNQVSYAGTKWLHCTIDSDLLSAKARDTKGAESIGAAGLAPMLSAPFVSRALADNKSLSIVQWSHFVPAYDTWFDKFAKDWGEKNKIAVTVDHIPVQNVPARAAAEASAGSGHDLFGFNGAGGAHLYRKFFVDVSDLVKETEKKYGAVTIIGRSEEH